MVLSIIVAYWVWCCGVYEIRTVKEVKFDFGLEDDLSFIKLVFRESRLWHRWARWVGNSILSALKLWIMPSLRNIESSKGKTKITLWYIWYILYNFVWSRTLLIYSKTVIRLIRIRLTTLWSLFCYEVIINEWVG